VSEILVVAHRERAEAKSLAADVAAWATAHGHVARMIFDDAEALGLAELASDAPPSTADLVVSLGGDGTMLRSVDLTEALVPVLGVNVGLLGYLTEVEPVNLTEALSRFFAGTHRIEERMLLEIEVRRAEGPSATWRALNEAVLEKDESGHTVRLAVRIDGSLFTTYAADGLIVATPTGSTAYSLSARGPIVSPRHRALLLTPVSPHMLFDRALVLDPDEHLELEVVGHRDAVLSVDGRHAGTLVPGDVLGCRASARVARLVRLGDRHFHQILKAKFGLADR
jgi:NAD+ kinase